MNTDKIQRSHLERLAIVYVRQSSMDQVRHNLESQGRQYELAELARKLGFATVMVIDEDQGRSGGGAVERSGFARLLDLVFQGKVGAVLALEASRLARNNRDWAQLVDLCAMAETLVIDHDGVYDPRLLNDRLLLGLKGTMSEFELGLLRQRAKEAFLRKAQRGAVMTRVAPGYLRTADERMEMDPDGRVQQAVAGVFASFRQLGSGRQVLLYHLKEQLDLPSEHLGQTVWVKPTYGRVLAFLTNPVYAGTFGYGRHRRERKSGSPVGHQRRLVRDPEKWQIVIHGHHPGYISWEEYERNQKQLHENMAAEANPRGGAVKGGAALLSGLMRCGCCGRMMYIRYNGRRHQFAYYECMGAIQHGRRGCLSVAARNVDAAVSEALLAALKPAALQAAFQAYEQQNQQGSQKFKALELALQQARYESQRARRQYDAVEPENRLVSGELEKRWEQAMRAESQAEQALEQAQKTAVQLSQQDRMRLAALAEDLPRVWSHPEASMQLKKRIVRCALTSICAQAVEDPPRVKLLLHWAGGVHTSTFVRRNRSGEHSRCTDREIIQLVGELAACYEDRVIAQVLNQLGYATGAGNAFNLSRVQSLRHYQQIPCFDPCKRNWLTLEETAERLRVSQGTVRKLLERGLLAGRQIVKYAPWMIGPEALNTPTVQAAVANVQAGRSVPAGGQQSELPLRPKTGEVSQYV
jgi:DNA invertase Pin-like site-specific DNA recombinase